MRFESDFCWMISCYLLPLREFVETVKTNNSDSSKLSMQKHNNFDNFEVLYIRFVYEL